MFKIIILVLCILFFVKNYIYLFTLFQQNHYDKVKFMKCFKTVYFKKIYNYIIYLVLCITIFNKNILILNIITTILILISFIFKNKYIIKLKLTKRTIITTSINILITSIVFIFIKSNIIILSYIITLPFIIMITDIIYTPLKILINNYYKNIAKEKLNNVNTINIMITGSFGKTSTKNILHSILSKQYYTLKTPKSYNTIMGISKTINDALNPLYEAFIIEAGMFRSGEIKEISDFVKPKIGIITEIGMQHLSTTKSMDVIKNAKFEILSGMTKDSTIILNYDNELIRTYDLSKYQFKNIYTYGINYGRFNAKSIKINKNTTQFDIYDNQKFLTHIETKLLAYHNISNILATFCTIIALKDYGLMIDYNTFKDTLIDIKNPKNRLEYKKVNNINIYDDSYSSNINGFKNAIDLLKGSNNIKIIITPGIVDGGKYDKLLNEKIAMYLIDTFDEIYLIDNKSSRYIKKVLNDNNKKYFVVKSFVDAYSKVTKKYNTNTNEVDLLIENDLPDSFLER